MITEERAVARLKEANPVPDPQDLEPVSTSAAGYLVALEQRSSEMTKTGLPEPTVKTPPTRRNGRIVVTVAAVILAIVGIGWISSNTSQEVDPAVQLEIRLDLLAEMLATQNAGDVDGHLAVFAPDAVVGQFLLPRDTNEYRQVLEERAAHGQNWVHSNCRERKPATIECDLTITDDLIEPLGIVFTGTQRVTFDDDNLIQAEFSEVTDESAVDAFVTDFVAWAQVNHPELGLEKTGVASFDSGELTWEELLTLRDEYIADEDAIGTGLTGIYVGSAIYEDENGSPHDRVLYMLELTETEGAITGYLSHAESGASSFSLGRGYVPVLVERSGDVITVRWDDSVGDREDTTAMQCTVLEISMTMTVLDDPPGLEITDGRWVTGGDEPSELDETCHNHGYPILIRGVLRHTETPPEVPEFAAPSLG